MQHSVYDRSTDIDRSCWLLVVYLGWNHDRKIVSVFRIEEVRACFLTYDPLSVTSDIASATSSVSDGNWFNVLYNDFLLMAILVIIQAALMTAAYSQIMHYLPVNKLSRCICVGRRSESTWLFGDVHGRVKILWTMVSIWFVRHIVTSRHEIWRRGFIFRHLPPNRQGAAPNLTQIYFHFRPISRLRVHPRSDCQPSECPRPTPTTQSVLGGPVPTSDAYRPTYKTAWDA